MGPPFPLLLLLLLHLRTQVAEATGTFELQIRSMRREEDLEPPCPGAGPCRTFFRVCLKEYQLRVQPGGPCVLGTAATPLLQRSHAFPPGTPQTGPRLEVPFDFAWPRSYSLILEAWDAANESDVMTAGSGRLVERVTLSGLLTPGQGWQELRHRGRSTVLDFRLRLRCQEHYYGPACNRLCRPRSDFFGHHGCDDAGNKVCLDGWTGDECKRAVCRQGCHETHGFCKEPGECSCHYGWTGLLCDQCILFPGCVHGSCTEPWKCNCETNWGGLLCDKDLNYCGSHSPCQNGGACANKEPNEYECLCPEGFGGRNCENALLSSPSAGSACAPGLCANGGTCLRSASGPRCLCLPGWSGERCQEAAATTCLSKPCSHGGSCQDLLDGFRCLCPPQWTGKTCQIDVNECQKNPCLHSRSCKNLIGGYFCDCLDGWKGPNCNIRENACQVQCRNGGTCQVEGGTPRCSCREGYAGAECETQLGTCGDDSPCLHGGRCREVGSQAFQCSCPPGFSGSRCEILGDLCSPNPCPKGASCLAGEGTYLCSCPEGALCQKLQEACPDGACQGGSSPTLLYGMLPLALILISVALLLALMARRLRRKPRETPPGPREPATNNGLQPDAVRLIRNATCAEGEAKAGTPAGGHLSSGLPKTDISNEERAKLNQLNRAPSAPRALL